MSDEVVSLSVSARAGAPTVSFNLSVPDPPPPDRGWFDGDWDLLKALKVSYWGIRIVHVLGKLLGFFRERFRPLAPRSSAL